MAAPPSTGARTLRLTTPFMVGADVAEVQRALGVPADGLYGPVTASAIASWKRESGYPEYAIDNAIGPTGIRRLLGEEPLPPAFQRRARARARALGDKDVVRERAVARMEAWAEAGLRERGATNVVPELVRLAGRLDVAAGYRRMGFPWCAFAAFLASLEHGGKSAHLGLRKLRFNALYCPTVLAEATAGRFGLRVMDASQAARGDLVLFDWDRRGDAADHLGRLREAPSTDQVSSVDGNSGPGNVFVALRERPPQLVRAYVRDS
jgi:hypothetical protein